MRESVSPMKKILAILLIILLGVALGVSVATLRIRTASWNPALDEGGQDARPPSTEGGKPEPKLTRIPHLPIVARFAVVK